MLTDSDGDLLEEYSDYLNTGNHLAIMPVARLHVEYTPRIFPNGLTFYPVTFYPVIQLHFIQKVWCKHRNLTS